MKLNVDFKQWLHENPSFERRIQKENSKWGRIATEWNESKEGKTLKHLFAISINLNTGDCYLDCRRRKIWAKQVALIAARPLQGGLKTLFHLSMTPVAYEIFKGLKGKQSTKTILKNSCKSLADIVRTPAYTLAMTIVAIVAVVFIPLSPNSAYDFREWHGKLEQSLFWGNKHTPFTVAICFQSIFNVIDCDSDDFFKTRKKDTKYPSDKKLKKFNNKKLREIRSILKTLTSNLKENEKKFDIDGLWGLTEAYERISEISDILDKTPEMLSKQKSALRKEIRIQNKTRKRIANAKRLIRHLEKEKQLLKNEKNIDTRLINFVRMMIRDRRFNYNPFYQLIGKLDPMVEYKSAYFMSHQPESSEVIDRKHPKKKKSRKSVHFNQTLLVKAPAQVKVNFSPRSDLPKPKHRGYQKVDGQPLREILGSHFYDTSAA